MRWLNKSIARIKEQIYADDPEDIYKMLSKKEIEAEKTDR